MANWALDFQTRNNIDPAKIALRAKYGIHVRKSGGEIEATFVGAPCHYQDSQGQWQAIDTTLRRNTVSNKWYAPGVPVDISDSDGSVSIYGGSWAHKTSRVGIWDSRKKTFAKAWDIPELGAVDGDSFVRSGKGWEYRQRVTESGLREELTLFQKPSISLPANTWLVLETYVPGLSAMADGEKAEWVTDGMQFPLPGARDSSGIGIQSVLPCKRWKIGNYLYTGIQAEILERAVYPVVVDPDFTSGTADAEIYCINSAWATARSTSGGYISNTNWITPTAEWNGSLYTVARAHLLFDTSSAGAAAIVTDAKITMTVIQVIGNPTYTICVVKHDWSGQNPISDANRETVYDAALAATLDDADLGSVSGLTAGQTLTSGSLSTAWVSKTGTTYYSLLDKTHDYLNSAPTANAGTDFASADHATASYRPKFTVLYYYPHHRTLLGVGT